MPGLWFALPALFAHATAARSAGCPAMQAPVIARHVVFSHGQEAGPWGRKITALAEGARGVVFHARSVGFDGTGEVGVRGERLVEFCKDLHADLGLVGSSLGGYI